MGSPKNSQTRLPDHQKESEFPYVQIFFELPDGTSASASWKNGSRYTTLTTSTGMSAEINEDGSIVMRAPGHVITYGKGGESLTIEK